MHYKNSEIAKECFYYGEDDALVVKTSANSLPPVVNKALNKRGIAK